VIEGAPRFLSPEATLCASNVTMTTGRAHPGLFHHEPGPNREGQPWVKAGAFEATLLTVALNGWHAA
jgi:hypothetical protein